MGGKVYLKTDRFEVKLEGIRFKPKDFEHLCNMDFLFPNGKVWDSPPVVGLDVMRYPRDPSILLVLLCFGIGCVILRFVAGEPLPVPIYKFLSDKRIHFVGFGIPEKKDLFPFEELGLTKYKADIGYLAAKILKQPKCKKWELGELARKVLGIKKMVGLTDASSSERHEQIKCAICQLFITSVIAMGLLRASDKKKLDVSPKKSSFLKNLNSLHCFTEGWFKGKKKDEMIQVEEEADSIGVQIGEIEDLLSDEDFLAKGSPLGKTQEGDVEDDYSSHAKVEEYPFVKDLHRADDKDGDSDDSTGSEKDGERTLRNDFANDDSCTPKMPLKGILKCPSTRLQSCKSSPSNEVCPSTPASALKRANSKGFNVSFKCQ